MISFLSSGINRVSNMSVLEPLTSKPKKRSNDTLKLEHAVLTFVLALAILGFDLSIPLGVAAGVPYILLVWVGIWLPHRKHIYGLAVLGTALTIFGYFLSPEGGVFWVVLFNRGLAIFAIWIVAILIISRRNTEDSLRTKEQMLQSFLDASRSLMTLYSL